MIIGTSAQSSTTILIINFNFEELTSCVAITQGMRGMALALEKMSESYGGWCSAIWSAVGRRPPPAIAHPDELAATLQHVVADTAEEV